MAHGFLMGMAAEAGIKVILNGQGADELFFGYNNMAQAILLQQLRAFKIGKFRENLDKMNMGRTYMLRTLLKAFAPGIETRLRNKARVQRRTVLANGLATMANDSLIGHYDYSKPYDVWRESLYAVALPHLVQYDDRNGMSRSIEGRMPFLDHRIAEYAATIQPDDFLKHGKRKYLLREACRQYLPDEVYHRTDKIGFYTPLTDALYRDAQWVADYLTKNKLYQPAITQTLLQRLQQKTLDTPASLQIWRCLSVQVWMEELGVQLPS
jgi:asparagine synthase (glutamine-hydrolysing)